jgi:nucleotide-binding universal stress UspA family protein
MTMAAIDRMTADARAGSAVWIVGVDGSEQGERALRWAVAHAEGRARRIDLVTAWQSPIYAQYPAEPVIVPDDDEALAEMARHELAVVAERTRGQVDITVDTIAVQGGAAAQLLEVAGHADLLVLGSRGRGGFRSLLLGSTSAQCAAHAMVPTVVVRGVGEPVATKSVLVGVDGSPNSLAALGWAISFAAAGSIVRAVWVWDASPLAVGADVFFFPDASTIAMERFDHLVDGFLPAADAVGVTLQRRFLHGRPRDVLLEESAEVDLVVAGAQGHGAVGGALLGSVSTALVHRADRPLVIVPNAPGHQAESTA